ncbi:MAG: cupredoxin domain-containing protein [Nevskiaceae bacterium]|nr:MAG: cupredoxin domain-containing protein [Nevskiaceae bacterium]TBR75088.1 MAG: cupredoxin domain-containing protein [Nevskiaceae bacterium]
MTLHAYRPIIAALLLLGTSSALMAAPPEVQIQIKDRGFVPAQIEVPADTKVKLVITNADTIPAEFESNDLSREVIVPGHARVEVYVGPLKTGKYEFFNDFHTASTGTLTVR